MTLKMFSMIKVRKIKSNPKYCVSPPVSAKGKNLKDLLESVRKTMNKKYPNHRFVLGYHNDKKNIHTCMSFFVFVIMTVNELISGKRFTGNSYRFCEELKMKGYDVKATHKAAAWT